MTTRRMKLANLDEASLNRLRQMEEAYGTLILALEPHHALAELSSEQINQLRNLEEALGVLLIAYRPQS